MIRVVVFFCVLLPSCLSTLVLLAEDKSIKEVTDLVTQSHRDTVLRYFSSNQSYRVEDLLVQSQVSELQNYLRSTKGHSPSTHPKLLKRVLPDHSHLAKLFYQKRFKQKLRDLSKELDGYESLHRMCHTAAGSKQLENLLENGETARIILIAKDLIKKPKRKRAPRIYTVGDFLDVSQKLSIREKELQDPNGKPLDSNGK